ncbi:endonuclease-reverse transcriptase [Trichonephila clavipes]|nr:endonuclease-reverse transcriptase [Trichonephila clavipes]
MHGRPSPASVSFLKITVKKKHLVNLYLPLDVGEKKEESSTVGSTSVSPQGFKNDNNASKRPSHEATLHPLHVIRSNRLRWLGHIWRSPENNQTRAYTFKNPMGSQTRGRPPTRWIDDVENDLKTGRELLRIVGIGGNELGRFQFWFRFAAPAREDCVARRRERLDFLDATTGQPDCTLSAAVRIPFFPFSSRPEENLKHTKRRNRQGVYEKYTKI